METRCDEEFEATAACHDDRTDLKLISLAFGASGLGIRLSKSSWDPYPFVSHVDEDSIAQERGLLVGDCILKVNGVDCLGETIQNIAKQIHSPTDDDSNEVNLLLWRSTNAQKQQGYQPQLLHNLVSDLISVFQLMECPVCMEIPSSPTHTFQCVNGHIVCEKCRPKTPNCSLCRVRMGRGRCLVADKVLRYLQNNSSVKIGFICDSGRRLSSRIDEEMGQKTTTDKIASRDLHAKRSTFMPFKLKLKQITFWKNS